MHIVKILKAGKLLTFLLFIVVNGSFINYRQKKNLIMLIVKSLFPIKRNFRN